MVIYQSPTHDIKGLPEALQQLGHAVRITSNSPELTEIVQESYDSVVILHLGEDQKLALSEISSVIEQPALHDRPIVFVGKDVDGYSGVLDKYFSLSVTVGFPYTTKEVTEALRYMLRRYRPKKDLSSSPGAVLKPPVRGSDTELRYSAHTMPQLVFEQLERISSGALGMPKEDMQRKLSLEDLGTLNLLPANAALREACEESYSDKKRWGKEHLCRTTYIAERFRAVIGLPEQKGESLRAACLLYSWTFGKNLSPLRKNYLLPPKSTRMELASKIKDSAMRVMNQLRDHDVGNILAAVARIIEEDTTGQESEESMLAACLIAADLIDRICYVNGFWSGHGAHFLLREGKAGKLNILPPSLLACVLKFLNEAMAQLSGNIHLTKELIEDLELQKKAKENREYIPEPYEAKVEITSLEPGMRLSKPIVAYDGRKILSEEIILDEDLIWRLWQLSTVRPMNAPLVVLDEKEEIPRIPLNDDSEEVAAPLPEDS